MKLTKLFCSILTLTILIGCSRNKLEEKGFSVSRETVEDTDKNDGIAKDSLKLETRPGGILLTGNPQYRLTPVYKVNFNKRTETTFIGSNYFYSSDNELTYSNVNQWHYNFMPGIEAVYGYNLVNVSHYDINAQKNKNFFESPVLIKTLYFPSFTSDTLNSKPVSRNYYMISVYDDDTNKDGFINVHDLRRFYYFDLNAINKTPLIPNNYSVLSSEYDSANDFMYVYAKLDKNGNGKGEDNEEIHIFWIDLKNPLKNGRQY